MDVAGDEGALWLRWLVRLRWVAIVGQIVTLSFTFKVLWSPWLLLPMCGLMLALAMGNLRAMSIANRHAPVDEDDLLGQLGLDVLSLTAFFLLAGGASNPFTILYVIHVAMAAIMLPPRRAAAITGLVLGSYGTLHLIHLPLRLDQHTLSPDTLIALGRVVAFALASVSVATFVVGLSSSLRRRDRQLLEARDRTARTDRLRSVGTLAAGAAHELNTPLSTIGLRVRRVARRHDDAETQKDLDVIVSQLDRCKRVVEQLLVGAGDPSASGLEVQPLVALVDEATALWSKGASVGVDVADTSEGAEVEVPRVAFVQALINLLENAREAQHETGTRDAIRVEVGADGDMAAVKILDRGCGLPDARDQVGEPFFTTKATGTGLGVFVARAVADGAGGGLSYSARDGGGTVARWYFPIARGGRHDRAPEPEPEQPAPAAADRR